MPTFLLTLRYDGTDFAGSQAQPGKRTVQGELEHALGRLGGTGRTLFAGRTDRGVHALGQVAAARLPDWRGTPDALVSALNACVPDDLGVTQARECAEGFNPRFAAIWREYRYCIVPGVLSPFVRRYAWTPRSPLDVRAMNCAAHQLEGQLDFATFASGGEGVPWSERASRRRGTVRTLKRCLCETTHVSSGPLAGDPAGAISIEVVADGFLPQMVRNIVGALVEVGRGAREPQWIADLLDARDRRRGPSGAPAHGLTLWRIEFSENQSQ